jgi:hypothetical protein
VNGRGLLIYVTQCERDALGIGDVLFDATLGQLVFLRFDYTVFIFRYQSSSAGMMFGQHVYLFPHCCMAVYYIQTSLPAF